MKTQDLERKKDSCQTTNKSEFQLLLEKKEHLSTSTNNISNSIIIGEIISITDANTTVRLSTNNIITISQAMIKISKLDIGNQCAIMFQQGLINKPMILGLLIEPVVLSNDQKIPSKKLDQSSNNQNQDINLNNDYSALLEVLINNPHDNFSENKNDNRLIEKNKKNKKNHHNEESFIEESIPAILHIRAKEQIVLECGDSIFYMDANGHIEMRANQMINQSKGLNRIKGASVKIN